MIKLILAFYPMSDPYRNPFFCFFHLFTFKDFIDLCRRERIRVRQIHHLATSLLGRLLIAVGRPNAGAERVIVQIARAADGPKDPPNAKMD